MIEKIIMAISVFLTGGNLANNVSNIDVAKNSEIKTITVEAKWEDTFSQNGYESFESVIETKDGGFVAVGQTTILEQVSLGDGLIVKYDKDGEIEWQEALLGEDTDIYYDVVEDISNGDFYVVGKSFSSDLGFENSSNISNAIIVKYNKDGEQQWISNKSYSGKQINYNDVIISNDKLYIVGTKTIDGFRTGFLNVFDKETRVEEICLGYQDDQYTTNIKSIIDIGDNSYMMVGNYINKENSKEYPLLIKINSLGTEIWSYDFDLEYQGTLNSIVQTKSGDFIVGGSIIEDGSEKSIIASLNINGEVNWKNISNEIHFEKGNSVLINENGEILFVVEKTVGSDIDLTKDLEVLVKKYSTSGDLLEVTKITNSTNFKHMKSIYTSQNALLVVGRKYMVVEYVQGQTLKCETRTKSKECLQADGYIVMTENV